MTVAFDPLVSRRTGAAADEPVLRSRAWDRIFVAGGAWLVPIPILTFYLGRALGLSVAACEDLVTVLVMVPLGGPHVFATYTRTFLNPRFRREDRLLFLLAFAVVALVVGAAVTSAFFDVLLFGSPPIRYVLTFFFFWAGVHIVQQNAYIASCYPTRAAPRAHAARRPGRWWGAVDYAVMLLALYPASLFRMSMVNVADPTMQTADPDALATHIVTALGGAEFADEYVFRIGRVAPILPEFLRSSWMWIGVTVAFAVSVVLFAIKTRRERAAGTLVQGRHRLVFWMAVLGAVVPLFPNLDSSFQGMNAWHSFQYLGLLWLMNQKSRQRGEIRNRLFDALMAPGHHARFYLAGLTATLLLLSVVFAAALGIEAASGGEFALFGHSSPRYDAETGQELYRPGAVLLAYYMVAFGVLLTHYLHDGVFFFRRRYLVDPGSERT
ncbi:MAG: hypothetical protein AB7O97_11120 [Planctomycetota bacterium]